MKCIHSLLLSALSVPAVTFAAEPVFHQDFTKIEAVPDELMVLNGEFTIVDDGGNKVLALNPAPLDTDSCLFGPTAKDGLAVRLRVKSATKGRQAPAFGAGLGGVTGYVLRYAGAKKSIELVRDDAVLATAAIEWKSDTWMYFHLQVRKAAEGWMVEGKAWDEGAVEPAEWLISYKADKEPLAGRASCWGMPYSGKPILYDDLTVQKLP